MTQHGKIIITLGIGIFTAGALLWIILANWQWIAAGFAIFVGTAFTSLILSVETKNQPPIPTPKVRSRQSEPTWNVQTQDNWHPPSTPPPDQDREEEESRVVAEDVNIDPYWGKQDKDGGTPS